MPSLYQIVHHIVCIHLKFPNLVELKTILTHWQLVSHKRQRDKEIKRQRYVEIINRVTKRRVTSSVMFVGKAGAYLSEAPFRCSTLGLAPGLTPKHYTRLETHARGKHSCLLQKSVNYGHEKLYSTSPRCQKVTYNLF